MDIEYPYGDAPLDAKAPAYIFTLCNCPTTGQMHMPPCPMATLEDLLSAVHFLTAQVKDLREILIPYKEDCQAKGGDAE